MKAARPGRGEYEVEAALLHAMRARGAVASYPPIVAAGANACVMHYQDNRARLQRGELLLVDAGAEVECYASDVTRTWPVGGRFSREQRALYEVVLEAQAAAIDAVRVGAPWDTAHHAATLVITEGLCALKLLRGSASAALRAGAYKKFFPHETGHWIGLDVHDVGDYRLDGESRLLEPGMVLTVEPGLYVMPDDAGVPAKWRGIGIRTEDDAVVTRDGHRVLTRKLARSADEIEAFMAR